MAKRALVVDDRRLVRDVLVQMLTACGFESQACTSLDDTIKSIDDWRPDVVMLDLRMPGHDGFVVIEQIFAKFSAPPKVIAVSGEISDDVRRQTEDAGFVACLQKPFRTAQILAVLERVFGER